jgi:hypothetical protein
VLNLSLAMLTRIRWMFILIPAPGAGVDFAPSEAEYLDCVRKMIGDDALPMEILGISKWFINETVAEYYSEENMYVCALLTIDTCSHYLVSASEMLFIDIHLSTVSGPTPASKTHTIWLGKLPMF